jgi:dephospho-CoA kinase
MPKPSSLLPGLTQSLSYFTNVYKNLSREKIHNSSTILTAPNRHILADSQAIKYTTIAVRFICYLLHLGKDFGKNCIKFNQNGPLAKKNETINLLQHIEICMLKLGITGRIASGKTIAAGEFARLGGKIISADEIGRKVVEENPPVLSKLIRAFGRDIVNPDGSLKRRELGMKVFASQENRQTLNKIVHPPLLRLLEEEMEKCLRLNDYQMVIIDAALLIDWSWQKKMDFTVCVIAPEDMQISRLREEGFSMEEIRGRLNSQKTLEELESASDFVINNDGSPEELRAKVRAVYEKIKSRAPDKL